MKFSIFASSRITKRKERKVKIRNFEMLDDKICSGYMLLRELKTKEVCNVWWDAWKDIIYIMDYHNISEIHEFDEKFRGTESIVNWANDFNVELHNAGIYDYSFLLKRIEFCSEYIERSENKEEIIIKDMKRAIAESYIQLGKQEEGDGLFESYLREDPKWGWGWIGWSDCYWIFHGNKHNDYEKAETILKRGLAVEGLIDRKDVMVRLMNFYDDIDREDEAEEVERELDKLCENVCNI